MITFDASSVDRLGLLAAHAARAAELIVLDHHASNPGFGTLNLIDPAAAATAVLAGRLIDAMGVPLTAAIAAGLYTGLVTDTGSFRFSSTAQVHRMAARLIETGLDPAFFARELLDRAPFGYLRLLSAALGRAVLEPGQAAGYGLVWTTVTREDRAADRLPYEVTEDVIDEVRRTDEAEVAVVFKESDDGLYPGTCRPGRRDASTWRGPPSRWAAAGTARRPGSPQSRTCLMPWRGCASCSRSRTNPGRSARRPCRPRRKWRGR